MCVAGLRVFLDEPIGDIIIFDWEQRPMTKIAVAHAPLGYGGSERVCLCVLEALQDDYEVTLLTDKDPDFEHRNSYFNTSVNASRISVRVLPQPISQFFETFPHRLWRLKQLVFNRYLSRVENEYDIVFSTMDEYDLSGPSVQYIHYPKFHGEKKRPGSLIYRIYDRICSVLLEPSPERIAKATLLANSHWTANFFAEAYPATPRVVYPPVEMGRFNRQPWETRENGFVSVGRLSPEKRLVENIDVAVALVERGHDIQYSIVGPDDNSKYATKVRKKAAKYDFVHVLGKVTNDELAALLSRHRYGLHGMHDEHFGIAIAEMAGAGMIPFIHKSGGQQEVLSNTSEVMYDSQTDAVEKIDRVLSDVELQQRLQNQIIGVADRFGDERFQKEILETVRKVERGIK